MLVNFFLHLNISRLVVFKTENLSLLIVLVLGVAIVHSTRRGMCKASTAGSSFNDSSTGNCSYSLKDVAIIGSIHDLSSMRQTACPELGSRSKDMDETTCSCDSLFGRLRRHICYIIVWASRCRCVIICRFAAALSTS